MNQNFNNIIFYRLKGLSKKLDISKSTILRGVRNGTFPKPLKLSEKVTAWQGSDIEVWLEQIRSKTFAKIKTVSKQVISQVSEPATEPVISLLKPKTARPKPLISDTSAAGENVQRQV